jgi:hypothetical protein
MRRQIFVGNGVAIHWWLLKWCDWIAQRPNHCINNFIGRFAMNLRQGVLTITPPDFPHRAH